MSVYQNRAFEWVSQDLQPFVLGFLILVTVARFLYVLWPKWRVFKRAPFEDRFNYPIKRLGNTIRIAILQAKMFKETTVVDLRLPGGREVPVVVSWSPTECR